VANLLRERAWYDIMVPRLARRDKVDVLLMPVNLAARKGAAPQVVSILDVNFLSQPGTYDRSYAAYAGHEFARSCRIADILTTISRFSRQEIAARLDVDPERLEVVYPGLDVPMSGKRVPPIEGAYALYVGATEPHKNIGVLIQAWRGMAPGGMRLAIVGQPGRDDARLRRLAAQLGNRVALVGAVTPVELENWYAGARVFCFPSRTEGFGYPPLEAMQRGIPVVAAAAGALPEVLGDAALFHDPDDVNAVREHVWAAAEGGETRQSLIARGHEVARRYRWDATAETMSSLLWRAAAARN
jgi:glycosyltransferase involved in cell wall biosynthesis